MAWEIIRPPPKEQIQVCLGLPHTGLVPFEWAMEFEALRKPMPYQKIAMTGQPIDTARNLICKQFLKTNSDWLFFLDSDVILGALNQEGKVVPDPDALLKMISRNLPILSGIYYRRSDPPVPGIYQYFPDMKPAPGHKPIMSYPDNSIIEVDAVGAGALLINRRVLETVPFPWFFFGNVEANEFCVLPGEEVFGGSKIEDVIVGEKIWDEEGSLSVVTKQGRRIYDGNIVELIPSGVKLPIKVTEEHGILVKRNSVEQWVQAKEVEENDLVSFPIFKTDDKDFIEIQSRFERDGRVYNKKFHGNGVPKSIPLDEDILELFGWFVAEGAIGDRWVSFFLNPKTEEQVAEKLVKTLKDKLGLYSFKIYHDHALEVRCANSMLCKVFREWFGSKAENKHFPKWMLQLSTDKVLNILTGLWRGDGYTTYNGEKKQQIFGINIASRELSIQVFGLLGKLGLRSTVRTYKQHESSMAKQPIYVVKCIGDAPRFAELFRYKYEDNRKHRWVAKCAVEIEGGKIWMPIKEKKVTPYYGLVYDLHLEPNHGFLLNGVTVHNSEDFAFNHKADNYGFKTYVDTSVQCMHILQLKVSRNGIQTANA